MNWQTIAPEKSNFIYKILSYSLVLILFAVTINNSFFWDTVQLGSLHANYYYTTNFSSFLLPNSVDSGHIPVFGIYIAAFWKMLGRTLLVSHLAMLPFIIGLLWQLQKLTHYFVRKEFVGIAMLLILIDPTLLGQITLVSPDVPLVFFFLMAVNATLSNKKFLLLLSTVLLFLISMRGMMVALCILSLDIYCNISFKENFKNILLSLFKRSLIYLPALLIFIAFSWYHYNQKGWIGYHQDSPWASSFESVSFSGFLRNVVVLLWRLWDFGRIGVWAVIMLLLLGFRKQIFQKKKTKLLIFFCLILLLILPSNMLWAKGLMGHRYLLPIYLTISLFGATVLFSKYVSERWRDFLLALWLLVLATGNLWIYPPKIAQGWDATLAHLPYYELRNEALSYLDQNNIEFENVATFFPNNAYIDDIDLNNDDRLLTTFNNEKEYVFYSNIFNVSDGDYDFMANNYREIRHFENKGIYISILKRNVP